MSRHGAATTDNLRTGGGEFLVLAQARQRWRRRRRTDRAPGSPFSQREIDGDRHRFRRGPATADFTDVSYRDWVPKLMSEMRGLRSRRGNAPISGLWLAGGCASGSTPSTHTPRVAPAGPEGHPNATAPRRRAPRTTFRRAEPIIARRRDRAVLAQQLAIMSRARQDGRRIDALMTSAPPFRRETGPHRPPSRRSPGALLRLDACPENRGLLPWGVMLRPRVLKSAASPCHSRAISHWGWWPPRPHHRAAPPRPRCRQRARWT